MKKILAALITLFFVMLLNSTDVVWAKSKSKKENQEQSQRIEYLNLSWWEHFNDPLLTSYIQELYEKNHDLKIAALKVKEGEKMVKISFANELPQVSFDGSFGRIMPSSNQQFGNMLIPSYSQYQFQMPLTASYEIDIWGENRLKTKSIEKQLEMIREDERASYIALTSAFASEYYNIIKTDKLIDIQKQLVDLQKEIAAKTEIKYRNGLCSENEVLNEQKLLTSFQEELNNLLKTRTVLENQLKVYLSDSDKIIDRANYDSVALPEKIPVSYDTSVIEKRPDYVRSEDYIKKIGYDVRVAKREFLPKFVIYGQMGFNAYQWSKMFNSYSQLANAGILPSFDLFSGGRKVAVLKLKKYQYEEAMQNYQKTILTSMQEINDNSVAFQTAQKNYQQSLDRFALETKKYTLMSHKNEIGAASNLEVLYNKEQKLVVQRDEVSNKINCIISAISLYKAVGGQDLYRLTEEKENI